MIVTLLATLILAQTPGPVTVDLLPFSRALLDGMEQAEIRVNDGGLDVVYSGVPLIALLGTRAKDARTMPGLRSLSDAVFLVRGADGYQISVSAVAAGMDPKGERYLLATKRDGRPLIDGQGPVKLIVPTDPKHARWVKDVASVRLVHLDKLVTGP